MIKLNHEAKEKEVINLKQEPSELSPASAPVASPINQETSEEPGSTSEEEQIEGQSPLVKLSLLASNVNLEKNISEPDKNVSLNP